MANLDLINLEKRSVSRQIEMTLQKVVNDGEYLIRRLSRVVEEAKKELEQEDPTTKSFGNTSGVVQGSGNDFDKLFLVLEQQKEKLALLESLSKED